MISLRHHLVSLVAVFLALAVGVVLGGGPLSDLGRVSSADGVPSADHPDPTAAAEAAFADKFAVGMAPRTLARGLAGQSVVLVTMPGADPATLKTLAGLVTTGGGTVVSRYTVEQALVDPTEKSLVDTLGSQLVTSLDGVDVPPTATTYVRMGRLLGVGVATSVPAGAPTDANATSIVESLKGADLVSTTATAATKRGSLVLVVMGDEPARDDTGADVILSGLTTGLAQVANGVVLAGSSASGETGLLSQVRGDELASAAVTMTDSVQTGAGQVTAVLALAAAKDDEVGSFGASGADGALPLR